PRQEGRAHPRGAQPPLPRLVEGRPLPNPRGARPRPGPGRGQGRGHRLLRLGRERRPPGAGPGGGGLRRRQAVRWLLERLVELRRPAGGRRRRGVGRRAAPHRPRPGVSIMSPTMLSEADPPPGLGVALWRDYFARAPHGMVLLRAVRDPSGALEDLEWREVNPAAAATLQLEAGGVVGRRAREVRLPAVGRGFYRRLVRCLRGGSVEAFEQAYPPPRALVVGAGGSERRRARPAAWYAVTIFPLADDHLLVAFRDVTRCKDVLREAVDQLTRDDLTGLANRRHLKTRFWVLRRREVPMALLYFDLNGFKAVNDTYGHEVGDRVLAIIGRRLLDNVRPAEVVARLGG